MLEAESAIGRRNKPIVVGRRVVHHPRLGDYEDAFSIGDPWRDDSYGRAASGARISDMATDLDHT